MKLKSISLFSLTASLLLSFGQANDLETTYYQDQGFKKVAFFAAMGGSSHYNWVLNICDELGSRGHNTTFLTAEKVTKFGKPFKHVQTVPIVPDIKYDAKNVANSETIRSIHPGKLISFVFELNVKDYKKSYLAIRDYLAENEVDLALCDHFAGSCVDAAKAVGIPYIITTTPVSVDGASAPYITVDPDYGSQPTTEFQSLFSRFYDRYVSSFIFHKHLSPVLKKQMQAKKELGLPAKMEDQSETWKDSLILVNNAFGLLPARPLGPLVELIGPIMNKQYPPLTDSFKTFLDSHQRVAYIAFGQTATPSPKDATTILLSLLEGLEQGVLDGFIWSTVNSDDLFPETVKTKSGKVYHTQDIFAGTYPEIRMVTWSPQMSLLLHPSVRLFVSHAGFGSISESIFAGKPLLLFPFFGDQPNNARWLEQNKLGMAFAYDTPSLEITKKMKLLVEDKDSVYSEHMKRMKAHVQIRSRHSVIRGADLVEEVLYTHRDGVVEHRVSADRRMSYIKAHNLDLYALLSLVVTSILSVFGFVAFKLYALAQPYLRQHNKLKTQ
ncbi:UDP-glucuronosyltransferase 2B9 [Choanephora cucurbitarum]|uniref:UDP-glucuronosyltransferase 2B9 n=1 Tax=Choanephora cucurbitarum TaxID=101091 RepID=A0A1C7NGX0_9FUNG|nr:UDP-glucuronosyltransferase 2B9 [Choanephora cucurbitarum]